MTEFNKSQWISTMRQKMDIHLKIQTSNQQNRLARFMSMKDLLDFLTSDLRWIDPIGPKFLNTVKYKLKEFKKSMDALTVTDSDIGFTHEYYDYLMGVEEKLGFARYCTSTTDNCDRCRNRVVKRSTEIYCFIHKQKIQKITSDLLEVTHFPSVLADMIIQYNM